MALEMELSRRSIPYRKYGGLRFVEMAHVKDLVSFLRLAENPRDAMAALRVLGLVPGIGPKTASALQARLAEGGGDFEAWVGAGVPEPARDVWPEFVSVLRSLAGARGDVPAQVHAVRTVYAPLLERRYDNVAARVADIEQIEALAGRTPDRSTLLAELAIDPPAWTSDLAGPPVLDEDWLVLSTMHSAKGLEFDVVYVIHAADGNIPSDMATGSSEQVEEERRLFYVACTRARHHLYVSHPLRYYKAGKPDDRRPRLRAAHPVRLRDGRAALPGPVAPRLRRILPTRSRSSESRPRGFAMACDGSGDRCAVRARGALPMRSVGVVGAAARVLEDVADCILGLVGEVEQIEVVGRDGLLGDE